MWMWSIALLVVLMAPAGVIALSMHMKYISVQRGSQLHMAKGFAAAPAFKYSGILRPGKQSPTAVVPVDIGR